MQTKTQSAIEAAANAFLGWGISVVVGQLVVYPYFGYEITIIDNFGMTAAFVAVSYARSYLFRRAFNWLHKCHRHDWWTREDGMGFYEQCSKCNAIKDERE